MDDHRCQRYQYICQDICCYDIVFLITDLILYFFIINDITDHDFILVSADSVVVHILIGCIDRTRIQVCSYRMLCAEL